MGSKASLPAVAIAKFLADEGCQNQWLAASHVGLYVRKSVRPHLRGEWYFDRHCLDVAAWEVRRYQSVRRHRRYSHAHIRQLVEFMKEMERAVVMQGWAGLFVELVRDQTLQKHLREYGYVRCAMNDDPRPCFFKSRTSIVATSPWVRNFCGRVHALPKPSLSAFAADPSLAAYWIHDQASGYQILLKRELIDAGTPKPQLRVTVVEFSCGVAKKVELDSEELPPSAEPMLGRRAMERVLARVQRSVQGVSQLAVRLEGVCQREGELSVMNWLLNQGYHLERHNRMREPITDRLVKQLR